MVSLILWIDYEDEQKYKNTDIYTVYLYTVRASLGFLKALSRLQAVIFLL